MLLKKSTLLSVLLVVALMFGLSFSAVAQDGEVEIFSWWTGGGEEEGLNALIELFNEQYPDVEVINATVAGGAGSNAKAVLKTRMVGGNPPDSFQVHGGAELVDTYVETGMMQPITGLLEEWGVKDKFNQQILEMSSYEGEYYSIPVNVHRSNAMFYNKSVLEENGVEPPTDLDSFVDALAELDEAGVVPLALGDTNKWPAGQIFETLLVATLGPDGYNGLWNGSTAADDPAVREALVYFDKIMEYVNDDHSALTWQDATQIMQEGEAGFNIMGDWAEGYLKQLGWTPGEEFGWMPVPGSEGTFIVVTDTFGLPKGAPNPENAKKWLKTIASVEGQDTFNPIKGSIPARLDADESKYDAYLTSAMEDFASDTLSPSIVHGSAAPEGFITAMNDTINEFITTGDVDQAFESFQANHEEYVQ
ncbi:carbohydrate ABC transporter substrate-binding protein (CUT1 family) [Halanaerobium saccharolyticum]|uniref:Probable sugar-binding periplasmic protein n=1 Tax=Halanaerobium saccharolyticum TaxID=43595 RepID=A0A4R7Z6X2_9FIRM|nr:ABC transporter substrate-binding protein [Halanaerobium saccharolyticum]RAK08573.1 carbohydrate ABC transporter substrate-binding protein (CUT1 family) [Halanaerobium saccharolyticum]TDW07283.1 carbohydrate ABC transporter substrate-binding protein (CUT1 family) [Halanaerobium saccharolyticum]TDX60125.1 carbohydrate ABC transporter substrate-binding protein (CUT1 family) [Halanaerobium saccharolyticum]